VDSPLPSQSWTRSPAFAACMQRGLLAVALGRALLGASAPATGGVLARVAHSIRVSAAAGNACAFDDRARAAGLRHTSKAECRHACARVACSGASYIAGVARRAFFAPQCVAFAPQCVASATTLRRICNHIALHLNHIALHLQPHCVASATTLRWLGVLRRPMRTVHSLGLTKRPGAPVAYAECFTAAARWHALRRAWLPTHAHTRSHTRQRPTRT
jgi:hypothetical protein